MSYRTSLSSLTVVASLAIGCGRSELLEGAASNPGSAAPQANLPSNLDASTLEDARPLDAPALGDGRLCSDDPCTSTGCSPVLLLPAGSRNLAVGLAVDAHKVCVARVLDDGTVEYDALDRCGGPPSVLYTVSHAFHEGMLLDGDELTIGVGVDSPNPWTKVWRRSLSSANPSQMALLWSTDTYSVHVDNLVRSADSLYFSSSSSREGIYSIPYAGGSIVQISDWVLPPVRRAMVRVAGTLYFSYLPPDGQYGLYSMPAGGGTPTLLSVPQDAVIMNSVATDGKQLFWGALGSTTVPRGFVGSIALDGSSPQTLADVGAQVLDLVVDSDAAYFTTNAPGGIGLHTVPSGGGAVTALVTGVPRVDYLTQDADYLFFAAKDGVYRLRKPGH